MANNMKPWSTEDDQKIENLYKVDKMSIDMIAQILERTQGSIIARLKRLNIIDNNIDTKEQDIITIKDIDYILEGENIYTIDKVKGSLYGKYNKIDNTVFSIKNIGKIVNYLETQKDYLRILYIGLGFDIIKEYFREKERFHFQNNNYSKQSFTTLIFYKSILENLQYLKNVEIYGNIVIYESLEKYDVITQTLSEFSIITYNVYNNMFFMILTKNHNINMKLMFLDTETTGLYEKNACPHEIEKFKNARLVELGYIIPLETIPSETIPSETISDSSKFENSNEFSYLIKPDNYTIENSHIHGITTQDATENGHNILLVFDKFYNDLKNIDVIICHNINFDMNILLSECFRYKQYKLIDMIESKQKLCTMVMSKQKLKLYKTPKLIDLYKMLYDNNVMQEHRTISDCRLCKACYIKLK